MLLFCRTTTASRSSRRTAAPPAVHSPAWWASYLFAKGGCFLLLCAALLAVLLPSCRGALSCACGARGKLRCSVRLCVVCFRLLHSALDVVARRAALKYAARAAAAGGWPRCRLCGRGQGAVAAWLLWAGVVAEHPWPLMSGESAGYTAGPCGVLAPSLDVHGAACVVLIGLLASFT